MEISRNWRLNKFRLRLEGYVCPKCDAKIFPPKEVCPNCLSRITHALIVDCQQPKECVIIQGDES